MSLDHYLSKVAHHKTRSPHAKNSIRPEVAYDRRRIALHAGQKLKLLRNARNLTGREVEQASRRIAAAKGDKRFCISNGWLTQLENGDSEPSLCKIFSLSAIYHVRLVDLVCLYGIDIDETEEYSTIANPHSTNLLLAKIHNVKLPQSDADNLCSTLRSRPTTLLPETVEQSQEPFARLRETRPARIAYGYIGQSDITMYPMIRPGSFIRIDTSQTTLQPVTQHSQFERPIYFVELRNGYACGWCELQGNDLLVVPHPSSPARIRRFTYMKDAEIVGRVISYDTRCVDEDPGESDVRNNEKLVHSNRVKVRCP